MTAGPSFETPGFATLCRAPQDEVREFMELMLWIVFRFTPIMVASLGASWFETPRQARLLTMRVRDLILQEHREAMRLEGSSH